tara:strand:+ start:8734 stop:9117 length:384 start_codon:yes stop_codon:yes gene_type:complete
LALDEIPDGAFSSGAFSSGASATGGGAGGADFFPNENACAGGARLITSARDDAMSIDDFDVESARRSSSRDARVAIARADRLAARRGVARTVVESVFVDVSMREARVGSDASAKGVPEAIAELRAEK